MEAVRDAHAVLAEMGRVLGELEGLVGPATSLAIGPFSEIEAVDAFGSRLRDLEGVLDVVHRGFEGERALFDVRLRGASLVSGR